MSQTPVPTLRETARYFGRVIVLVRPFWAPSLKGLLLGVLGSGIGLVTPYISKLYFDSVYPARDTSLLKLLVAGAFAFAIASSVLGAIRGYYTQVISASLGSAVNLLYFNHLQHLPMRFFDERRVGEITSRMGDLRASLGTVTRVFQTLILNGAYVILVPPFLLLLSWKLTLVALATVPVTTAIATSASRVSRKFIKQSAEAGAELNAVQVEIFSQMRTFKAMGLERRNYREVRRRAETLLTLQSKSAALGTVVGFVVSLIRAASAAIFTWYAWSLVLSDQLTIGGFVAFSAYLGFLTGPINQIAGLFSDVQTAAVTLGRAFEYLDMETEQDVSNVERPPAGSHVLSGRIDVRGVSFGYVPEKVVLREISIDFSPQSITAIVGESGCGKSTLVRLLCGLERMRSGEAYIDEHRLADIPLESLRAQVAVVWQDTALVRGTLLENLVLGNPDVSLTDVHEVLRECQLSGLVGSYAEGLDTMVAEFGATLSGGQRQRFALARALLRPSPILILDEVTSQLDPATESRLLEGILPRLRTRTTILVTHRASTAAIADRTVLLHDGAVAGVGTYDELLVTNLHFQRLLSQSPATTSGIHERRIA